MSLITGQGQILTTLQMKKIKQFISEYRARIAEQFSQRFFYLCALASVLFVLIGTGFLYWQLFPGLADRIAIPLHYNIHFGVDLFGPWYYIFLAPVFAMVCGLVNAVVALRLWKREPFLSYAAWGTTLFVSFATCVATIFITLLNIAYA
jgi:hypothetical protein